MVNNPFLLFLLSSLCISVASKGFDPFEVIQAFSGLAKGVSDEGGNPILKMLMNKDAGPGELSVHIGRKHLELPPDFSSVHAPITHEIFGSSEQPRPTSSEESSQKPDQKTSKHGEHKTTGGANSKESMETFSPDEGSGQELEEEHGKKPKSNSTEKSTEKPVEPKKSYIELAQCFLKYAREDEQLGYCFSSNEITETKRFYLAAHPNKDLEKNCKGSFDVDEFIKQRSVHKELKTNQIDCHPSLTHNRIKFDFEDFERGSVHIIQQWRLMNSTKTETRNYRDPIQRFAEVVKVQTEVYGLECIHFVKTTNFWLMTEKARVLTEKNFEDVKERSIHAQFRIDRLRSDGEWGFPLKTSIEKIPAPSSRLGTTCELKRSHRPTYFHDDLKKA